MNDDNPMTGIWVDPHIEGGCSHCFKRTVKVAKVWFGTEIVRFCPDCLTALRDLADSMLEE